MKRFISFLLFPLILSLGLFFSAFSADDVPIPVTDKLLRKLGLDRDYHKCISVRCKSCDHIKCPFCLNHNLEAKPGKTSCPECAAEFEVDDRLECIFADTSKMRLPVNGMVCGMCGLVQGGERENCLFCGTELITSLQ